MECKVTFRKSTGDWWLWTEDRKDIVSCLHEIRLHEWAKINGYKVVTKWSAVSDEDVAPVEDVDTNGAE